MRDKSRLLPAFGLLFTLAAVAAAAQEYEVPAGTPGYVVAAIESEARTPEMTERDAARKPAEILTLSEIKPGDRVIEIAGFGHYYSTLLSEIVGDSGSVDIYDLPYLEQLTGDQPFEFAAARPNTEYHRADYADIEFTDQVDIVLNILYYHDLGLQNVDTESFNSRLFDALKPGGIYLIVDHKAEEGSGWRDVESLHRMGTELIVEEVTAAGFVLELESDLLANPDDDRKSMVFAPGTRGATDRAVFVFRKPN